MFIKLVTLLNIKNMNYFPTLETWYHRYHIPETFHNVGSWIVNYKNWRAVPYCPSAPFTPEDGKSIGYYNYRAVEITFRKDNLVNYQRGNTALTYPPKVMEALMGYNTDDGTPYTTNWPGKPGGPNPITHCFIPAVPTEDYLGQDLQTDGKDALRWYVVHKYPVGVSMEEGEKWFLDVFAKEVMQKPGILRFFSSRAVEMPVDYMKTINGDGSQYPFMRVTELWFEDFSSWRNAILDSKFTKPSWAKYDQFPFLQPYTDFCSTFLVRGADKDMSTVGKLY